jgi:hypothetical protein
VSGSQLGLELLKDADGCVALGWVGARTLYARVAGDLSATLGSAYASRLQDMLGQVDALGYFFTDASRLQSYDLLARSAFVRAVHANRRAFASIVILIWSGGTSTAAEKFAVTLGKLVELISDPREFELRLLSAAPLAQHYLNPDTWVPSISTRPSAR